MKGASIILWCHRVTVSGNPITDTGCVTKLLGMNPSGWQSTFTIPEPCSGQMSGGDLGLGLSAQHPRAAAVSVKERHSGYVFTGADLSSEEGQLLGVSGSPEKACPTQDRRKICNWAWRGGLDSYRCGAMVSLVAILQGRDRWGSVENTTPERHRQDRRLQRKGLWKPSGLVSQTCWLQNIHRFLI